MANNSIADRLQKRAERFVTNTMRKYSMGAFGRSVRRPERSMEPVYEREFSPFWIKSVAEQQSLVNNSIEEKVNQAFRRGFEEWEKEYEAKCPRCDEEFTSLKPFKEQLGDEGIDLEDREIDFSKPRVCPNCDSLSRMVVPDPVDKARAQQYFREANMREYAKELVPDNFETSISQSFLQVCKEVAFDIQTFDDGWMVFERTYTLDQEGNVLKFKFDGVTRAPPYLMRYSIKEGKLGNEYWVCLECRAKDEAYIAQDKPGPCTTCGQRTYEAFAYQLDSPMGQPEEWFINGEFAHDSEYRPSRLYGLSPIVSLKDETRALQSMDAWYRIAYEKRRAPRGAIVVRTSNNESLRAWNQEQLSKLNTDPQHIPTMMDDSEGAGSPITWQPLLDTPAEMQNMQMREWFLDRVSAKYGVTAVFQSANAQATGLSQSLEIVVSNRSAERLQMVFEDTFIPAFLGQLDVPGWNRHLKTPEEEDEAALSQLRGKELQNLRVANQMGMEAEWTEMDTAYIKPQKVEPEEDPMGGMGGMPGMGGGGGGGLFESADTIESDPNPGGNDFYSNPSDRPTSASAGIDAAGTSSTSGGRPQDANMTGGAPSQPRTPTTDSPYNRSVTTATGGYGNATYGGKPGKVIDVMRDIRDYDDDESEEEGDETDVTEKIDRVQSLYDEVAEESGLDMPTYEKMQRSVKMRPDTGFRSFKRNNGGKWTENLDTNLFVERVYDFIEHQHD